MLNKTKVTVKEVNLIQDQYCKRDKPHEYLPNFEMSAFYSTHYQCESTAGFLPEFVMMIH